MDRVLIVSSNEKATAAVANLVKEAFPACSQSVVGTGLEARRIANGNNYDAVIINCPLSDEYGNELAELISDSSMASCVMIVRSENADAVSERMEDMGVMVIPKPLSRQVFYQSMKFINASRKRLLGLQHENIKLQKKLEEIRNVNRAKLALMQYLGFTEQQAHRYLEKQAMDLRVTKNEVALKVIKMYEP
ncbi:MAG: ANTAR domain-containing response regulator [Oscillospiraceae bacterium]